MRKPAKRRLAPKPVLEVKGVKVRNKFELRVLARLFASNVSFTYEEDKLPYVIEASYNPDFKLYKDGGVVYIEAKGKFDYEDQRKMRAVKDSHPELDIRIVFMTDNRIRKGAKMKYSDWAMKHGFPFAIGEVPKEWLE